MRKFKKVAALALVATLVVGSSLTAYAEEPTKEGSVTGSGEVEGTVNTDVWNVVLPEEVVGDTTYNFILDPEGLIAETDAAKYEGADFEEGKSLFFTNAGATEDDPDTYSATSDAKTITNKSSYAVDVTISTTVTPGEGIVMNPDSTFADDTAASIYLAVTDSASQTTAVTTEGTATVVTEMAAAKDGSYDIVYDETEGYLYQLVADDALPEDAFAEYTFQLTGACNTEADWSALTEVTPSVTVVYSVDKHVEAPADVAPSMTDVEYAGTGDLVIPYSLGSGESAATALTDVVFQYGDTKFSKEGTWSSNTNQAANITIGEDSITIATTLAEYIATDVEDGTEYTFYLIFDGDTENYVTGKVTITVE